MVFPSLPLFRLNPLVRIRSVFPSGLTAVVTGWSAVNCGRSGSPGFNGWKIEPLAAVGVIIIPVGRTSGCDCGFCCAPSRAKPARVRDPDCPARTSELVTTKKRLQKQTRNRFEFFITVTIGSQFTNKKTRQLKLPRQGQRFRVRTRTEHLAGFAGVCTGSCYSS